MFITYQLIMCPESVHFVVLLLSSSNILFLCGSSNEPFVPMRNLLKPPSLFSHVRQSQRSKVTTFSVLFSPVSLSGCNLLDMPLSPSHCPQTGSWGINHKHNGFALDFTSFDYALNSWDEIPKGLQSRRAYKHDLRWLKTNFRSSWTISSHYVNISESVFYCSSCSGSSWLSSVDIHSTVVFKTVPDPSHSLPVRFHQSLFLYDRKTWRRIKT